MAAELVLEEVKVFGLAVQENEDAAVAEKLAELCMMYRLKENELADELVAFAAGKKAFLLTADFLNIFEHEALNKRSAKSHKRKENRYSGVKDINTIQELLDVEEEEENLLDAYTTPSKGSQKRAITTPENPRSKRTTSTRSPHLMFSPSSFSPGATPSQKYTSRGNRGEVVTSFGSVQGTSWSGTGGSAASVKLFSPAEDSLTKRYKFMFQKLFENREVFACKIEELGEALKEHYQIEEFSSLIVPVQEPVTVLGQIGCDSNGKLNARSVILEGDQEHSSGGQVPVDVSELAEYSLFPGQVVIMEGTNSTGGQLVASKLYEGVPLPFHKPTSPTEDYSTFHSHVRGRRSAVGKDSPQPPHLASEERFSTEILCHTPPPIPSHPRTLSLAAPTYWNELSGEIRALWDLGQFRRAVKMELFWQAFR